MTSIFIIISLFFSVLSFLPEFNVTHWTFRILDYIRIQLLFILLIILVLGIIYVNISNIMVGVAYVSLLIAISYQIIIIFPYLSLRRNFKKPSEEDDTISIISANVLQKNNNYDKLKELIKHFKPDIVLTMESNKEWEKALEEIEDDYSSVKKIPMENRYGMHFYTKLKVDEIKTHFFISDETPSIEAHLYSKENESFVFWGVHPPPPSPTEKSTSKQKDAELMRIAKEIRKIKKPNIVMGDFNNVCWSKSSKLFSKTSQLKDSRLGNGVFGTFPVRPYIFRIPIDLIFSSEAVDINKIKTLTNIGSDHLPIYSKFTIKRSKEKNNEHIESNLKYKMDKIINEGHDAAKKES